MNADVLQLQQSTGTALESCSGSHVYTPTQLPVCSGPMVQGRGAGRTGKLSGGRIVSGGAGDIIVGHHWGAHRLQCPVGGVLPVRVRVETGLLRGEVISDDRQTPASCRGSTS